jgi:hypothetical protein
MSGYVRSCPLTTDRASRIMRVEIRPLTGERTNLTAFQMVRVAEDRREK